MQDTVLNEERRDSDESTPRRAGELSSAQIKTMVIVGLVLGSVLMLYLVFPSAAYTGDGTLFADLVRQFGVDESTEYYRLLLHPHHLSYGPLAVAFVRGLGASPIGIEHVEILRLSHLSSFLSVLALTFLFLVLYRTTRDTLLSLTFTILLAFAHAFWFFSEAVEVQPVMLVTLTLFFLVLSFDRMDIKSAAFLGIACGLAVLSHVIFALLLVPAMMHLLRAPADRNTNRHRVFRVATYSTCVLLTAGLPYLLIAPWVGIGSPSDFVHYFRPHYSSADYLTSPIQGVVVAARSLEGIFLGRPLQQLLAGSIFENLATGMWVVLRVLLVGLFLGALFLRRSSPATENVQRLRRMAVWTLVAFVPLWIMWDVGNPEFLVVALPPVVLLLALAYHRGSATWAERRRQGLLGGIAAVAVLMGAFHFVAIIGPQANPENNPAFIRTEFMRENTGPNDIILISGLGEFEAEKFYLRYFGQRRRLVLQWVAMEGATPTDSARRLRSDLAQSWKAGSRMFVTSDVFDPENLAQLQERHGFGTELLDATLSGLDRRPVASLPEGFTLWELRPAPPDASGTDG